MPEPSLFRHYQIVQDADGNNVELVRDSGQVAVLAFDTRDQAFVHCHVLLEPLADKTSFESSCRDLQTDGHPLRASLKDFGEDDGNPFYITSSVDGETLRSYLARQQEIPGWVAAALAAGCLEALIGFGPHAASLPWDVLTALRIVQTGAHQLQIHLADFKLQRTGPAPARASRGSFEKAAQNLKSFFLEHLGPSPALPDQLLSAKSFTEALVACLTSADPILHSAQQKLREELEKYAPGPSTGEIPAAYKPRPVLAALFASYQEVARGVVNLVRIQSQRLDMSSPYCMRGTLTKSGRTVLVEQVPPARLAGSRIRELDEKAQSVSKGGEFPALIPLVLLHESEGITCLAEELPDGIHLADLLNERRSLSVREAYLILAAMDSSLDALEKSGLDVKRLRLEDIYVHTGFPREDARTAKLLQTKLNEWPAFTLTLRAHPTLAAMAGRGVDPAVLLPASGHPSASAWTSAWLAAVGRFLVGLNPLPGQGAPSSAATREKESLASFFDEEVQRHHQGKPGTRADFLDRYARILQHHERIKPSPGPISEPLVPAPSAASSAPPQPSTLRSISASVRKSSDPNPSALTSGLAPSSEKPTIGFAELLFRDTSITESGQPHDWAKTAADAPPTIHPGEVLLPPNEFVPFWLRAAVFLGGSVIVGAMLAHFSGNALWQKQPQASPVPKAVPVLPDESENGPAYRLPSASPGPKRSSLPPEPPPGPAAPPVVAPTLPQDSAPRSPSLLKPPASTLKDDL
ncbi:MAG TPA: hypothetical protein VGE29_12630 [Prosthecobacter sp.]